MTEYHNNQQNSIIQYEILSEKPWAEKKKLTNKIARSYNRIGIFKRAEKLSECGTFLEFAKYSNNSIKLHNANFCRVRMCPMCAWRRSLKVGFQVSQVLDNAIKDRKNKLLFLTLTIKNVSGDDLSDAISKVLKGYDNMFNYSKVKKAVKGAFRALEVTYNAKTNTYHPHLHIILLVDHTYGSYNDDKYISQREWSEIWRTVNGLSYIPVVDIRKVKPNNRSFDTTSGIAAEASKGETLVQQSLGLYEYMGKGVFSEEVKLKNDTLDEVVKVLDNALAHRKLVSFRGALLKIWKSLNLDDTEDGDLIHVKGDDMNEQLEYVLVRYRWLLGGYVLLNDENEPVKKTEPNGAPVIDGATVDDTKEGQEMTVGELLNIARNGTKVVINETVFSEEGDIYKPSAFFGTLGSFGKCPFYDRQISFFEVRGDELQIEVSRVQEPTAP